MQCNLRILLTAAHALEKLFEPLWNKSLEISSWAMEKIDSLIAQPIEDRYQSFALSEKSKFAKIMQNIQPIQEKLKYFLSEEMAAIAHMYTLEEVVERVDRNFAAFIDHNFRDLLRSGKLLALQDAVTLITEY